MNLAEAREIIYEQQRRLRAMTYDDLKKYLERKNIECMEIFGKSGKKYQIEIQAFWDDKPEKDLRVRVAIDDFGWRVYMPYAEDFIISPDGSFVDET